MQFEKPAKTPEEHIELLQARGLDVPDVDRAKHYLKFIGYYRLSAYCKPFLTAGEAGQEHIFKPNTTFESLLDLYIFDRRLRLHLMDAIERVEVAVRARLNDTMCLALGSHWYLDHSAYNQGNPNRDYWVESNRIVDAETGPASNASRNSDAVRHYYAKYTDPDRPPSWVVIEELSVGKLSRIYNGLENTYKEQVAKEFKIHRSVLSSWLHSLTVLRNKCAHHDRTWNSALPPVREPRHRPRLHLNKTDRLQGATEVLRYLMTIIAPGSTWYDELNELLQECPDGISLASAGFDYRPRPNEAG